MVQWLWSAMAKVQHSILSMGSDGVGGRGERGVYKQIRRSAIARTWYGSKTKLGLETGVIGEVGERRK